VAEKKKKKKTKAEKDAEEKLHLQGQEMLGKLFPNDNHFTPENKTRLDELQAAEKSARIPFKRVNPSLIKSRKSRRKKRALAYGRSGTILTSTLGGGKDDKLRKKTLLG
jgi:hypothetical protein